MNKNKLNLFNFNRKITLLPEIIKCHPYWHWLVDAGHVPVPNPGFVEHTCAPDNPTTWLPLVKLLAVTIKNINIYKYRMQILIDE